MKNELEPINNDFTTEKITISSLEKLDNNYIRIIGRGYFNRDIDVITNGTLTFDFRFYDKVKGIINFNECDYLIAENAFREVSLISLNDSKRIIKNVRSIDYIGDGLFGISQNEVFSTEKVFDLVTNDYVPFPENMIFRTYKEGLLVLQEEDKESFEQHKEMVIDRSGNIIIPKIDGGIRIIDKTKFIADNMVIDFNQKAIIQDADLVMPLTDDKIIILKNRKLFVLNNTLEVIKTYTIGETKKPWYIAINGEECITMTFKKKIRTKKYEPRIEKDITVIVNTKTDTVSKMDSLPNFSIYDIFKITGENHKKGLMNKKGEIVLNAEWDNIQELHDTDNKYFFIEKDDEHYIFNSQTKSILKVLYDEMKEFRDGLAIGYSFEQKKYQLIDEELNPVFNLDHMGHSVFYYKNGILCYHSGSWINEYDAYTIITQSGETLMPSRKCRVKRNSFELLEIDDYQTDKKVLFDMNNGQFLQLEMSVPMIETENGKKLDFSGLPIQQFTLSNQTPSLLQEDSGDVKRLLLKPKTNGNSQK